MSTARWKFFSAIFCVCLLGFTAMPACQQKCQPPAATPFKHLEDATWRAVETTNPNVTVTLFDFIELSFSRDFTGKVLKVVNNQEFADAPIEVFTWAVPANTQGSGQLRIQYSSPGTPGDQNGAGATPPALFSTDDYSFNLSNQLEFTESKTGYYWRFVPMTGIVDPDSKCTF